MNMASVQLKPTGAALKPPTPAFNFQQPARTQMSQPDVKVQAHAPGTCDRAQYLASIQATTLETKPLDASLSEALGRAATESRGLAMDGVAKANSGHLGLPLGTAEIGAVLFGSKMSYNPDDPTWINRDRFILSAGYALPKDELAKFRQPGSMTPGHPEFPSSEHNTPGIESTTGPLGQGVANAVGMAS